MTAPVAMIEEPIYLVVISQSLGWIYFCAWSLSFYGQVYENWIRKSVYGLNFDFLVYNLTGFIAYTIYTVKGFNNENLGTGPVALADVLFSIHALCITLITITQVFLYFDEEDENQKVSTTCKVITMCIWFGYLVLILTEEYFNQKNPIFKNIGFPFNHVIYLGFTKVFITMIKFIPQVVYNYERKSTLGWSIFNVISDFIGGVFSLAQNGLETYMGHSIIAVKGPSRNLNVSKYFLSSLSIFFDIIFMVQHYCLYNKNNEEIENSTNNSFRKPRNSAMKHLNDSNINLDDSTFCNNCGKKTESNDKVEAERQEKQDTCEKEELNKNEDPKNYLSIPS